MSQFTDRSPILVADIALAPRICSYGVADLMVERRMRAKDDCNQLLNATLPFAEKVLKEYGEFLPFGAQMLTNGEIVSVAADGGEDHPRSQQLIELLQTSFRIGAYEGTLIATALVYDVRVARPGAAHKSDAVAINLDHRDNYSVRVFFPYVIANGELAFEEALANAGDYATFPSRNPLYA